MCNYFEEEKNNKVPLLSINRVVARTAAECKISGDTVKRIFKQSASSAGPAERVITTGKPRVHARKVTDKDAIIRHIYGYYQRKELPTLIKLLVSLREADLYNKGSSSLQKNLIQVKLQVQKFE